MQQISLAGTGFTASRVAFGTASLHHLGSRERERLIHTAVDLGITHFDTSPYYGNGIGERSLGVLGPRMTVATKVGLYPPGGAHGSRLRLLVNRAIGRVVPRISRPEVDFSVARARRSLDDSLRRMRRERVDLMLLHEPRAELIATHEWQRWLETENDRVALTGVAGELESLVPLIADGCALARIIQTRARVDGAESRALLPFGRHPHLSYGHLAGCHDAASVGDALRAAFETFPDRIVLVSTRRVERVAEIARLAGKATSKPRSRLSA
jgi:hypothetical protein